MKFLARLAAALTLASFGSVAGAAQDASSGMAGKPHPEMQVVLDQHQKLGAKPIAQLTPEQARKQPSPADAVKAVLQRQGMSTAPENVAKVEDRKLQVEGAAVPMRIYTPAGGASPMPVVLYIHGGGWVIADLDTYDASPRALANAANAIVVSTHYRQAPEHPFPAAHDDTWTAYQWVVKNARSIGGDPNRIAVAGESAGGNMAASIAMRAKKEGMQMPVHQLLIYPVAQIGMQTESYTENMQAKPLDPKALAWFGEKYLKNPSDKQNPKIALLKAQDYKGLPAATIITAEIDPLRSEGRMLADKLEQAGVKVDYRNYEGVTHEFFGMGAVVPDAAQAVTLAGRNLMRAFEPKSAMKRASASQ